MRDDDPLVFDQMIEIFRLAQDSAVVATLEALADAAQVHQLQGLPVREFYERHKAEQAEHLVADFADTNPGLASAIKRAWEAMQKGQQ